MDSITIEKLGYSPIKPDLERIDKIKNFDDLINELAFERINGSAQLFRLGIDPDDKNPTKYIVNLGQGGTSLPNKDYYLTNDERAKKLQDALKALMVKLFILTGSSPAEASSNAAAVYNLESILAKAQLSRVVMRDPRVIYNKFLVADFNKVTPHLNWNKLLARLNVPEQDSILVGQPSFFKVADSLLAAAPVENWKLLLKWNAIRGSAVYLSSPFVKAIFDYNSALTGEKEQLPRSERISKLVDNALGELLGQLFVEKYFTPLAKKRVAEIVNNLKTALGYRIRRLDWMGPGTKERALRKLSALAVKIGYPDKWETYDGVIIKRNRYLENVRDISKWRYNMNLSRLGKPVDKTLWGMTPQTANAYNSTTNNEIVFPAAILQIPFFDLNADDAINYGAIGSLIGHDMTHGFDDKGRQYDADGILRDWWTKSDADKFNVRTNQLVAQYSSLTVLDSLHVNGRLTLGENIADLGGLNIAYEAFLKTKQSRSANKIDGFTPDQRFFLSWAQAWRNAQRPEAVAQRILTSPYPIEQHRTNVTLTNISAWYKAFNIRPGDKMYKKPEDRVEIW
jgi:putative endopeptidase